MKIMRTITPLLLMVLAISCRSGAINTGKNANAQKRASQMERDLYAWVEAKIDSTMRINNIPAISIGIVRNEKLVYARGFGVYEKGNNKRVNEHSLYQMGSDSKKFTAIIARNLVLEGKLALNEPITTYLPHTLKVEAKEKLRKITVKDLLLHNSGIPTRAPNNIRTDGDPMLIEYRAQDLIDDLNNIKLDFEPGTNFGYSNFGYAVLGFVCEVVSGQDYADLVKKYITDKLGMDNTFIIPGESKLSFIVTPYRKDDRNVKSAPWKMGKMTPAGGIYSNVSDIAILMIAQIKAYKGFNKTGKKDNPLILTETDGIEGRRYGFGLAKVIDSTGIRFGHGGDLDGYGSTYLFFPKRSLGLILLTSSGGRWLARLEEEIRIKLTGDKQSK